MHSRVSQADYVGNNAFGATANIAAESYYVCALEFKNVKTDKSPPTFKFEFEFELKILPENAKELKDHLRVVYIGKLTNAPYYQLYRAEKTPTLDSPSALTEMGTVLNLNLMQVWLVDSRSGNILVKKVI
jgi:hypothetical protein